LALNAAALEEKEFNHSVAKALNEAREEIVKEFLSVII
jgi:hypothetical protein